MGVDEGAPVNLGMNVLPHVTERPEPHRVPYIKRLVPPYDVDDDVD